jgi:iron complex transport system permease protein
LNAMTRKRFWLWMAFSFASMLGAVLAAPLVGAERIDFGKALSALNGDSVSSRDFDIVFLQRLPRAVIGALTGGALGLCGAAFQAVLRNPLATPFTLGVASAGALGAVLVVGLGIGVAVGPFSSVQLGALMGAGLDVALVALLARRIRGGTGGLLLAGVTVSLTAAALMMLVRYLSSPFRLAEMDRWLMGGLDVVSYAPIAGMLPLMLPGLAAILFHVRAVDQLSLGRTMATARGVNVAVVQRDVFIGGSLVTAAVVAAVGPIGFVGLIVPHAVRRVVPKDHRVILPVSFGVAGAFLVLADASARTLMAPAELPVGILTAAIGGPLFLWILSKSGLERSGGAP